MAMELAPGAVGGEPWCFVVKSQSRRIIQQKANPMLIPGPIASPSLTVCEKMIMVDFLYFFVYHYLCKFISFSNLFFLFG